MSENKTDRPATPRDADWWRGAVIYQIYPRSYADSNGDGIGDLPGIIDRLEYIASLGVDAIWISPFFRSPMKDFGYDVSDYRDVDPIFGTLEDFDALLARAHELGLAVLIDQVISHSSDQHPWFADSRSGRESAKADWYVWADAKADGSPPNNWLSLFGGSAWQWDSRREQYYLHNFLVSQPDLDFNNPVVVDQLLADVAFWLDRGVDGFRLDTVNFYTHDAELRDNPPADRSRERGDGLPKTNPYTYQQHIYDKTRPENLDFVRALRRRMDEYHGRTTMGEIGADDSLGVMAEYTSGGDKLHMAYAFDLMNVHHSASYLRGVIERLERRIGDGWPCWSLGNHDVSRVLSRWGGIDSPERAKLFLAILGCLRGSVCIYQGEELGLMEAEIAFEDLQDPYGITFWPAYKGRDGCRTPMPWTRDAAHAGFSQARPWLPVPEQHRERAVDTQDGVEGSVLSAYRTFLHWRRGIPALRRGAITVIDTAEPVLAFIRSADDERILALFNLDPASCTAALPDEVAKRMGEPMSGHGLAQGTIGDAGVSLPGHGVFFARLGGTR